MKTLANVLKKEADSLLNRENKLVHFYTSNEGYVPINPPKWSNEMKCVFCGNTSFYLFAVDKNHTAWLCGLNCEGSKLLSLGDQYQRTTRNKKTSQWAEFCEINHIGDEHYDVKFEHVQQSKGKIDYMLKFASSPRGIILMRGDPGTGKTFAAMAICEFFIRTSNSCIFTTQKKMSNNWLLAQGDNVSTYVNSLMSTSLLVIDDFATGEPNPKFLEFFMELINTRMQWKSRGTIITTNLNMEKFSLFCGEALADRIMTGQIFSFEGSTRRRKIIL